MDAAKGFGSGARALLVLAAAVIVVAGLRAVEPILTPIVLAAFVVLVITPIERWLKRRGLPHWAAMLIVLLGALGILTALSVIVASSIGTLQERLPQYEESFRRQIGSVVDSAGGLLDRVGVDLQESDVKDGLDPGLVFAWARAAAIASGGLLSNTLFVIALSAFMLGEATILPLKVQAMQKGSDAHLAPVRAFMRSIVGYVQVKTITSAVTGALVGSACAFVGIDFAPLWGLLAFLFNFVPNIGSIIAAVPPVALAFVMGGVEDALILAGCYVAVNIAIGTVIEPRLMGKRVGMSTLVIVLSLVFWGWVLGPVGMLLSVPLTMIVKLAVDQSEDLEWLGTLLGAEPERADDSDSEGDSETRSSTSTDVAPA